MNKILWQQYGLSEINGKRIIDVLSRYETVLPYFVDIVVYGHIKNLALKEHIDRIGICIYSVL